jgi:hypothetical protein
MSLLEGFESIKSVVPAPTPAKKELSGSEARRIYRREQRRVLYIPIKDDKKREKEIVSLPASFLKISGLQFTVTSIKGQLISKKSEASAHLLKTRPVSRAGKSPRAYLAPISIGTDEYVES